MSGHQSRLSDSTGIAQDLASDQREISIAEFFEQNKQMLGFGSRSRALVTAVKEAVDNSLDAAEEADILPEVRVDIEENENFYTVVIEDNGPGIPRDNVPKVFGKLLYGSRFHARAQTRGQQGIGISAAVMYAQLTTGNPARVTAKTANNDKGYRMEVGIDTDTNEPDIHSEERVDVDKSHGTRIELDLEATLRAVKRLHEYIRMTAVVNPHAKVELYGPDTALPFDDREVTELPADVEEIRPHPHEVEVGTLMRMLERTQCNSLRAFLQEEFTRVGAKTADKILDNFRDKQYGRAAPVAGFTDDIDTETYEDAVMGVVRNKGSTATKEFSDQITSRLHDAETITETDVTRIVEDAAESATHNTTKQFAGTVQTKATTAVWDVTSRTLRSLLDARVNELTVDRKSDELVDAVIESLYNQIVSQTDSAYRLTRGELESLVGRAADDAEDQVGSAFGSTARDKIVDDLWSRSTTVTDAIPGVRRFLDSEQMPSQLVTAMREADVMAPPTKCLSPISEENIIKGLDSHYDAEFIDAVTRDADATGGQPFVVEAGIAYGGELDETGSIELARFANRFPLVYQQGACLMTDVAKDITWNNYYTREDDLSQSAGSLPVGPMVLVVHVASTNVPFTSESKDAVANVPEIEKEVELAVREVSRGLKRHLSAQRSRKKRERKEQRIGPILEELSEKLERITDSEIESKLKSQARIMNNVYVEMGAEHAHITNFNNRSESVEVELEFDTKPTYPSQNAERTETDDGWLLTADLSLGSDEGESVTWNTDGPLPRLELTTVEPEKTTVKRVD